MTVLKTLLMSYVISAAFEGHLQVERSKSNIQLLSQIRWWMQISCLKYLHWPLRTFPKCHVGYCKFMKNGLCWVRLICLFALILKRSDLISIYVNILQSTNGKCFQINSHIERWYFHVFDKNNLLLLTLSN